MGGYTEALRLQTESQELGRSRVLIATKTLTTAQLLALFTAPQQMLPAPGVGKFYFLLNCCTHYRFGTVAFTLGTSNTFALSTVVGTTAQMNSKAQISVTAAGVFDQSNDIFSSNSPINRLLLLADVLNNPLTMLANNANWTLGDGTVTVTIFYQILDATLLN